MDNNNSKKKSSASLPEDTVKKLVELSHKAKNQAHCPYSKFRVGAALLSRDDRMFTGKLYEKLGNIQLKGEFRYTSRFTKIFIIVINVDL